MKKLHSAFAALIMLSLFSCEKEGWTDENKSNYLGQCRQEAMGMYNSEAQVNAYCSCNLDAIMKHYGDMEEVLINKDSVAIRKELESCSVRAQGVR